MKKILATVVLALGLTCAQAQNQFTVTGHLKGAEGKKVYLTTRKDGTLIKDSVTSKAGEFSFSGSTGEPAVYNLAVESVKGGLPFFVENNKITINGDVTNLTDADISGSKEHEIYAALRKVQAEGTATPAIMEEYRGYIKAKDSVNIKRMDAEWGKRSDNMMTRLKDLVRQYTSSYASAYIFAGMIWGLKDSEIKEIADLFSAGLQNKSSLSEVRKKLALLDMLAVGKTAPDFRQNDTAGKLVSLASFRGRYVLVDFWASWCKPCREENPNVVKNYHAFKNKNFTVLGISLDQAGAKEAWVKAINTDGLTWTQLSDLKFWDNAVAQQYGIQSIPANLLLDPDGKIIAKNIRGEELGKVLGNSIK